jgi:8-oxo-dGTP pyrophosphatase MutT (NUDIX family)
MSDLQSFGHFDPRLPYKYRRAAYAVILAGPSAVIAIKAGDKYWLPGGETAIREVREELGRGVRLMQEIGQATQYFYAADEDCNYKMEATFFRAEFIEEQSELREYEPSCVLIADTNTSFFHQCHAWAINQAAPQINHCDS